MTIIRHMPDQAQIRSEAPATRPSAIQSLDMPALLRAQAAALTAEANRLDPPRVPVDWKIPNE